MTTVVSSPSPRKTRSGSRSVSAKAGSTPDSTEVDAQPFPNVAVMKASSMEPVFVRRALQDKRPRHKMTDHQLQRLEELYQANTHPSREEKDELAREIGMTLKSVMIWFQNRRQDRRRKPSTSAVIARATQASSTPETTPSPALQPAGPPYDPEGLSNFCP
ncbi:homeobox-domain-containing protein, partial [Lentinus tigrinus ALCF2SS1-6]